jgi:hypothetical protein
VPGGCTQEDVAPLMLKALTLASTALTDLSDNFRRPLIASANTLAWNERFDAPPAEKFLQTKQNAYLIHRHFVAQK